MLRPLPSLCVLLLAGLPAAADTIYTYSGNTYVNCFGAYANAGSCATSYSLTGTLDLTLPVAALESLSDFTVPSGDIASFSFTDGFDATLNQSDTVDDLVEITTNSAGDITSWGILLSAVEPEANSTVTGEAIVAESEPIGAANADLSGNQVNIICGASTTDCNLSLTSGGDVLEAGSFAAPQSTPEPSTWLLLASGMAAVVFRRRARR